MSGLRSKEEDDSSFTHKRAHTLLRMDFCCQSSLLQPRPFLRAAEKKSESLRIERGREMRACSNSSWMINVTTP